MLKPTWMFRKSAILVLLATWLVLLPGPAKTAELLMFESEFCEWCETWLEDVGTIYSKTPEGKRAPLRRVDIDEDRPEDLKEIKRIIYTPTFVLLNDDGVEAGRILGYPGEADFWGFLSKMVTQLDADIGGCTGHGEKLARATPSINSGKKGHTAC